MRNCANCIAWDRDSKSRQARSVMPEERLCVLGPFQIAKRADDFCMSFQALEVGHDSRKARA
jgi:hypothetical protein